MRFREFGAFALEYELVCWVPSPHVVGRATHRLNRALYRRLDEAGIEVPYPKREVTYRIDDAAAAGASDGPTAAGDAPAATGDGSRDRDRERDPSRRGLPPGVRPPTSGGSNQSSGTEPADDA
jgi:hypothetical protein